MAVKEPVNDYVQKLIYEVYNGIYAYNRRKFHDNGYNSVFNGILIHVGCQ